MEGLRLGAAALTLIFILAVELRRLEVFRQAAVYFRFNLELERLQRLVGDRLIIARAASDRVTNDAHEEPVDARRVTVEVFFVDHSKSAILIRLRHFTVELDAALWGLLILQLREDMNEELVAIVLHGRVELAPDEVLQLCWVEDALAAGIIFERLPEEVADAVSVIEAVRDASRLLESFVIPAEVVVTHLLDRQQALKNGVHVAVERVVLQADNAILQVFHLLIAAVSSGDEVGGRFDTGI